jgi:glycosyltransferase involved in cell wall biosynthesis
VVLGSGDDDSLLSAAVVQRLPNVSVVIPAFRQAAFLGECLDSVQGQRYAGSLEVIVVDDGCPEGSGDVAARHPIAPRVIKQPNSGVSTARNRGVREAQGEYIAFLDADDLWHPRKLDRQIELLVSRGEPALSFTGYRRVDKDGAPIEAARHPSATLKPSLLELARQNFVGCSTVVAHRECLLSTGGFPDSAALRRGGQDYALWLRIASRYPLLYLPDILTDYRIHSTSRVGLDVVKNFDGAAYALQSFAAWAGAGVLDEVGASYTRLILHHARSMAQDLARRRADLSAWARALRATSSALRVRP